MVQDFIFKQLVWEASGTLTTNRTYLDLLLNHQLLAAPKTVELACQYKDTATYQNNNLALIPVDTRHESNFSSLEPKMIKVVSSIYK